MSLPPVIQTVTVSFGPFIDFQGQPLRGSTTFEPSTPVLAEATGTPILNRTIVVEWDADGMGTVILPATDSVGLDRTGFTYRVTHRTYDSGVPAPTGGNIMLPAAAPNVDLDLLVPVTASNGIVVEQPAVTSVAGLTGAPTAGDLVTAMDVPLRAAFVPRDEYVEGGGDPTALYPTLAADPDSIIVGAITRDANGASTAAGVVWPDATPGTYTATTLSADFPGAVDAYTVTYGSPPTKTYTQPAVTRDPSTGAVTVRPAIVES